LAGAIWLWRHDRKRATVFGGVGLTLVLGVSSTLELATGAFVANAVLANANPFGVEPLTSNLGMLALFQGGPIAVAVMYFVDRARHWRTAEDKLLACFGGASLLPLVGLAKVGSNHNQWIEFAAATSVLATLGLWAGLRRWVVGANSAAAVVPLLLLAVHVSTVRRWSIPPRSESRARSGRTPDASRRSPPSSSESARSRHRSWRTRSTSSPWPVGRSYSSLTSSASCRPRVGGTPAPSSTGSAGGT
jgi:hypothetical protein